MEVVATLFSLGGLVAAVSLAVRDIRRCRSEFAQCLSKTRSLLAENDFKTHGDP